MKPKKRKKKINTELYRYMLMYIIIYRSIFY